MKFCLIRFDAKRCKFYVNMSWSKEEQVKVCQSMVCPHGSITEVKTKDGVVGVVSCDFTWNPFDNKEVTEYQFNMMEYC